MEWSEGYTFLVGVFVVLAAVCFGVGYLISKYFGIHWWFGILIGALLLIFGIIGIIIWFLYVWKTTFKLF